MDELYEMIENLIGASGYPGTISGKDFYNDVSAEVGDKEPGKYMFLIKKDDILSYEGCMDVMEDQFDLHYVDIVSGAERYHVDFD